jgi:shikimate kinase / 3-dehydroquinate synthase
MAEANIVLTGFMGTGKTTIGRAVAEGLERRFVDLDDVIAERAGKSVSEIFEQDGEPTFRAAEARLCQEMREPAGLVVAAGGGAVVDPVNRDALAASGMMVCLDADPETIVRRLAGQTGRPLLSGSDRPARIAELLAQRAGAYEAIPRHLQTSQLSVGAAAERVMGMAIDLPAGGHRLRLKTMPETADRNKATLQPSSPLPPYDILIAEGLIAQVGRRLLAAGLAPGRCAVVTNPTVAEYHAGGLVASLRACGFEPEVYEVPDGEAHKTLATAAQLYDRFAASKLARGELVLAIGGGVIGDLAGFVAATWLRGVPFVQVPTTLLSMVDASMGGKVGVDLPSGKNLVGAFKQPALVLSDPALLASLRAAEFRSGLAEVLKSAIIGAPDLFEQLAGDGPPSLVSMIADAARVKVRLVERDPFESGDRAWLNLGHTFGHALELYSDFTLRHGEAVALGMIAAAELSAGLGRCEAALPGRVRQATGRLDLPQAYSFEIDRVIELMGTDKKRAGRTLRFVIPLKIGEVTLVQDISHEAVRAALATIRR